MDMMRFDIMLLLDRKTIIVSSVGLGEKVLWRC